MDSPNLRRTARGVVLDEKDNILLCRFARKKGPVVWSTPGGGVEPGETVQEALRRELHEEVGLAVEGEPPHVWIREVIDPGYGVGYDGALHHYFLVRTRSFSPAGALSEEQLAAEGITGFRWWSLAEIVAHPGPSVFAPRRLGAELGALLRDGPPDEPTLMGL
ncbi:NUDIX domain-containing protein [Streptomyces sp. NPDC050418]|uniref:NUDIX domain-containing protein n=1 Tax=Streptomyces sp. NPDC050418 TaxID=3365612 RepID=UPI00378D363C